MLSLAGLAGQEPGEGSGVSRSRAEPGRGPSPALGKCSPLICVHVSQSFFVVRFPFDL